MEALICPKCSAPLQYGMTSCPYCRVTLVGVPQGPQADPQGKKQEAPPPESPAPQPPPSPTTETPPGWVLHKDSWNGFTVAHPSGWEVLALQGQVIIQADPSGMTAAGIFPFTSPVPTTAQRVAQQYVNLARSRLPGFQAMQQGNTAPDSNRLTLRTRGMLFGQPVEGITNVLVEGTNCIVSGYNAPAARLAQAAPDLAQILATFHTGVSIARQVVREPSEGAFTLQIPEGWSWQASLNRNNSGGAASTQFTVARDPQGAMRVMMPSYSWMYTNPGMGPFGAFPSSSPILPLMPAARYIQQVIAPQVQQQYRDFKLEAVIDRPDFAEWTKWDLHNNGIPYGALDVSIAMMEVTYTENGARLRAKSKVTVQHQASAGVPQWNALLDLTYRAPEAEFAAWEPVLTGIFSSLQFNPQWLAIERRRSQEHFNVAQANIQRSMANISRMQQETSDMLHRSALNRIAAQDKNFEAFDDVINGMQAMATSSGQGYKVPIGYDRYWLDGLGTVHGGSWLSRPDVNWQELKPSG